MSEIQPSPDFETVCSLLGNERRKRVLLILGDTSGTTTRSELARMIGGNDSRTRSVERIDASLYHVHLPKLADENAIRYDTDAETVAITEYGRRLVQSLYGIEWKLES